MATVNLPNYGDTNITNFTSKRHF